MKITVDRLEQNDTTTIGKMYIDDEYFGYTLEDVTRDEKVYGETAIDAGTYRVILTMSNRFKRVMPLLLDVPKFTGIRIHGGNTHKNTEGCILVAKRRLNSSTIQGSLERELTSKMALYGGDVEITITNQF